MNKNINRILLIITLGLAVPSAQAIELDQEIIINLAVTGAVALVGASGYALWYKLYEQPKLAQEKLNLQQELATVIAQIIVHKQNIADSDLAAEQLDKQLMDIARANNIHAGWRDRGDFSRARIISYERLIKAIEHIPETQLVLDKMEAHHNESTIIRDHYDIASVKKSELKRALENL